MLAGGTKVPFIVTALHLSSLVFTRLFCYLRWYKLIPTYPQKAYFVTLLLPLLVTIAMASIIKNKVGTYSVYYRVCGKQRKRNFKDRAAAIKFRDAVGIDPERATVKMTVGELLNLYRELVTARKKGFRAEDIRIQRLMRCEFAKIRADKIQRKDMQAFADARTRDISFITDKPISANTVIREFGVLRSIFNWAVEQGYLSVNPAKGVHLPRPPEHRERVATEEDLEKLLFVSGWDGKTPPKNQTQTIIAAFIFSCRTGMRAGEIVRIEEAWIDGNVIHLPAAVTKTSCKRDVALGKEARRILGLVREANGSELFQMDDKVRDAVFRKVRDRADLGPVLDSHGNVIKEGLHFHDGRATFATWAASPDPRTGVPRLDVMALARQTGHKDLKMLMRYYRTSAKDLAERLE